MTARNGERFILVGLVWLAGIAAWPAGCSQSPSSRDGTGGTSSGSGGHSTTGGTSGTGGTTTGSGGSAASGGATASGGLPVVGSGGSGGHATGGANGGAGGGPLPGSGGQTASSGGAGQGGKPGSGGMTAAGGAGRGGGSATTGAGGATSSCSGTPLPAGNTNRTIQIGSASRSYILHVPTGYTGTKPVPLVLDFHALGGSGSQEQSSSGYQAIADKQGFIILFPNGIDNAWNIGPCCTNSPDVDDLGFAKGMVAAMEAEACIDTKRVYATGFSMGGGMCQYLACNAADMFAAVAPSSFDLLVPDEEPCAPSRPISVLAYRGTADTTVPYAGGLGPNGRITFLGAQGSFQRWASLDGCATQTTTDGDCTYLSTCTAGVEVGLCVKQGGGHAPGDANVGWAFLSKFTLP